MGLFSKKKSNEVESFKIALANTAFDKLLKQGEDYTVAGEIGDAILVKKEIKWAYFFNTGELNAMFSIKTDKGVFVFQARGEDLMRIPADIAMSIYKFK